MTTHASSLVAFVVPIIQLGFNNVLVQKIILVCLLYSFLLVFQALEHILYWYQAKLISKWTSIVGLIAYIVVSALHPIAFVFEVLKQKCLSEADIMDDNAFKRKMRG